MNAQRNSNPHNIRFFYNGLKVGKGPLQKGHWSFIQAWTQGERQIPTQLVLYARDYEGFSSEVREMFQVDNRTDSQTDYFEKDQLRIYPDHPLFAAAAEAALKSWDRDVERYGEDVHGASKAKNLREFLAAQAPSERAPAQAPSPKASEAPSARETLVIRPQGTNRIVERDGSWAVYDAEGKPAGVVVSEKLAKALVLAL